MSSSCKLYWPVKVFHQKSNDCRFSIHGKEFPDIYKVTQAQRPHSVLSAAHSSAAGRMQIQSLFHTKLYNPILKIVLNKRYFYLIKAYFVNLWTCIHFNVFHANECIVETKIDEKGLLAPF